MERPRALVVDADQAVRRAVAVSLAEHGFAVDEHETDLAGAERADVLVTDPRRRREAIASLGREAPDLLVVGLGAASPEDRLYDWLEKPIDHERLRGVAQRLRSIMALRTENRALQGELQRRARAAGIVGRSRATESLIEAVTRHAGSGEPVWFVGEPGVGKEHAARVLHAMSARSALDFVVVACSALPSHPTASGDSAIDAPAGTLYLDGIAAMPLEMQRLVDQRARIDPRGDTARIVASDSIPPRRAEELGRLHDSLGGRFEPRIVTIPPLRERAEDVAPLARHFGDRIAELNHLPTLEIDGAALAMLEAHPWPGNVAELRSAIEHAVLLATGSRIGAEHLPDAVRGGPGGPAARSGASRVAPQPAAFRSAKRAVVRSFEASYLRDLLAYHGGNVTAAARQAGMLRSALQRLLRKHGLRSGEFRASGRSAASEPGRASAPSPTDDRS